MTTDEKVAVLRQNGWVVGERDPRLVRDYPGRFMVAELPTPDNRDGLWCAVGDDLKVLVDDGFDAMQSREGK